MPLDTNEYKSLKYVFPVRSFIDTSFYERLSELKLDKLKLEEANIPLSAILEFSNTADQSASTPLFLNGDSFNCTSSNGVEDTSRESKIQIKGAVLNFNKLQDFKDLDKQQFIRDKGVEIWNVCCREGINNCVKFFLISFADLKKYKYTYWLLVPSMMKKGLKAKIKKTLPQISLDSVREWFKRKENKDKWVCISDGDCNEYKDYDPLNINPSQTVFIRDSSNMHNIPSSITKTILSKIKFDNPKLQELKVYFIRDQDLKSFGYELLLEDDKSSETPDIDFNITGWERTIDGKLQPRQINLSSLIDPLKIAEQNVDLNLKLMKWRIVPDLNLDVVKTTRVLLLGAGTLGCFVARSLMAWGVRDITFVDNGTVSYSNLVRQPLFEFTDCGKPKAEVAAMAMKKIFPLVNSKGINISIPMIGHPITNEEREHKEFDILVDLFNEHDVIYLLMDSREARWLPTVLANVMEKKVINAALGFDSYLVMRHGEYKKGNDERLGCYFCNDVVVPTDSLTSRTLDQMCTVTRPGVAMMASAQAVELMVSLLQKGTKIGESLRRDESILGEVPHQIRGFLDKFETLKIESPAYEHCSACSSNIVDAYQEEEWEFVRKALNDEEYIEKISGLLEIKQGLEDVMDNIVWMSDEEEFE